MSPDESYHRAKALLYEHFGNLTKIDKCLHAEGSILNLNIKVENVSVLQDCALFLCGCCNAMSDLSYFNELNMSSNMKMVISKLPYKMKEQFRNIACDVQETQNCRSNFNDIVNFIARQLKIISDPVFGDNTQSWCFNPPVVLGSN